MTKSEYRTFFAKCIPFIKISYFCKQCNVSPSCITVFMNGYDNALCDETLIKLYNTITDELNKVA